MSDFLGLTWNDARAIARACPAHGGDSPATLVASVDHLVSAVWWPRSTASSLHGHGDSETWLHVVSGSLVEERWTEGDDGEWRYELVHIRAGQCSSLPRGAYHRVRASVDASVISTFSPPHTDRVQPADPSVLARLLRARRRQRATAADADAER